eukprot:1381512-Amphidinium_carterae.1
MPPLPVTKELVHSVGASLKAGGYKSAHQYYTRAVQEHTDQLGHRPADDVIQAINQATRSIVRAAAGSARKASFQLEALAPHVPRLPHFWTSEPCLQDTTRVCIIGCWWMLRGIELRSSRRQDMSLDD